jgi:hypothetical protein
MRSNQRYDPAVTREVSLSNAALMNPNKKYCLAVTRADGRLRRQAAHF